jgi:hypothetical protein
MLHDGIPEESLFPSLCQHDRKRKRVSQAPSAYTKLLFDSQSALFVVEGCLASDGPLSFEPDSVFPLALPFDFL